MWKKPRRVSLQKDLKHSCEICHKREGIQYNADWYECDKCMNNYMDRKFYRCNSPSFISNKFVRFAYKLKIPYIVIHKVYGQMRFI